MLSFHDIRGNQFHAQLLGELITAMEPAKAGLFGRLEDPQSSLTDDDRAFLRYAQYELSRVVQRFEPLRGLTDETMRRVFAKNPDLQQFMEKSGVPPTAQAARELMMHLAVRHQGAADRFLDAATHMLDRAATSRAQTAERKMQTICEKANVPRENYEMLIVPGDKAATRANFQAYFEARAKGWEKWASRLGPLIPGSSAGRARSMARRAMRAAPVEPKWYSPRSWVTSDIHEAHKEMASFFTLGIGDGSDAAREFRDRIERYAVTGALAPDSTQEGPRTYTEARRAADMPISQLQSYFDRDKIEYARTRGVAWEALPQDEREQFRDALWAPPELDETLAHRGLGLFSLLARAIGRLLLGQKEKQLRVD